MNDYAMALLGVSIPLVGTLFGAGMVYLLKTEIKPSLQKFLLGFASGVMIAASVWSLLIPSLTISEEQGAIPWIPAALGFLFGMGFLMLLDYIIPHLHRNSNRPEGLKKDLNKPTMLILAVTLHNIPEGMAVGVVFAGVLSGNHEISMAGAFVLAIGIALQNYPEGAVISMPLLAAGASKHRAFVYGALSGIVEPVSSVITILLTAMILPALPYMLSFAAGAMFYVVVEELIPESQASEHSDIGTIGAGFGFALMMILDVALG